MENVKSEADDDIDICRRMLETSFSKEHSKVNSILDVVKALLQTKRRMDTSNKRKYARSIQILLDDLGEFVEGILFDETEDEW